MKKVISILAAVLIISLSVMPAFAESVESPSPTKGNYNVTIVEVPDEGGSASFTYDTPIRDDGYQTITLSAVPEDDYEFAGWTISGEGGNGGTASIKPALLAVFGGANPSDSDLKSAELTIDINHDIVATAKFQKKDGSTPSKDDSKKTIDDGSKSPQTGANDVVTFAILSVIALALVSTVVVVKKTSKK